MGAGADVGADTGLRDREGLEVLDLATCLALLGSTPVARIAFVDRGEPVVLPVNHLVDGSVVAFRTALGSTMDVALMERPVAVEADAFDEDTRTGWSVLVKGAAEYVDDEEEVARLDAQELHPWADKADRSAWVRVRPTSVSGRRIVHD